MELALLRAGSLAGLERTDLLEENPEVIEHAFDTATKMMATVHRRGGAYFFLPSLRALRYFARA